MMYVGKGNNNLENCVYLKVERNIRPVIGIVSSNVQKKNQNKDISQLQSWPPLPCLHRSMMRQSSDQFSVIVAVIVLRRLQ